MDAILDESATKLAICGQHDLLQERYQKAMEAWATLREESWHLGLRGKELNGELLRLQGEFARSYAQLHKHSRECLMCQMGEKLMSHSCVRGGVSALARNPD
jgi:hypothetical protein